MTQVCVTVGHRFPLGPHLDASLVRADTHIYSALVLKEKRDSKTWIGAFAEGPDSAACCSRGIALIEKTGTEVEARLILMHVRVSDVDPS